MEHPAWWSMIWTFQNVMANPTHTIRCGSNITFQFFMAIKFVSFCYGVFGNLSRTKKAKIKISRRTKTNNWWLVCFNFFLLLGWRPFGRRVFGKGEFLAKSCNWQRQLEKTNEAVWIRKEINWFRSWTLVDLSITIKEKIKTWSESGCFNSLKEHFGKWNKFVWRVKVKKFPVYEKTKLSIFK